MEETAPVKKPSDRSADADEDALFDAATKFLRSGKMLDRMWPGKNSCVTALAMATIYRSKIQGYDLDVSSFAAAMNMPRTSAHRMLNEWEKANYVRLERSGRKTHVYLTSYSQDRLLEFLGNFAANAATQKK